MDQPHKNLKQTEVATLGGGCFWCTEAVFSKIDGVMTVEPGYSGGKLKNPTYEQVSAGTTGHAEVVQITFDPKAISFKEILKIFFTVHNPTTLNRQGADVGTQYRSAIFYHTREQRRTAQTLIEELDNANVYNAPIVTQIEPFKEFYRAEDYHKDYFKRHPEAPYCRLIITPKLVKLRQHLATRTKT